jgi:hypothetical protein
MIDMQCDKLIEIKNKERHRLEDQIMEKEKEAIEKYHIEATKKEKLKVNVIN